MPPADARAILGRAATDGNALTITERLGTAAYARVSRVLAAAGAEWSRKAQARLFPGDAGEALAGLLSRDRVTSAAQEQGWFPTPPAVVERLLDLAAVGAGMEVLEPSAGEGAIAGSLAAAGARVDCVELHPGRAAKLALAAQAGLVRKVIVGDFLAWPPRPVYHRVVMNPPFAKGADVAHVRHALRFVRPGGRLVAVMSAGLRHHGDRKTVALRGLIEASGGRVEDAPDHSFRTSGTDLATVLVLIPVRAPGRPCGEDGPVRVTFDRTATGGLPLFDPATARRGVYVHYDAWAGADAVFRFAGNCIACGAQTWRRDDCDNDVRGPFGEHTGVPLYGEDLRDEPGAQVPDGVSFPRCARCWNDAGQDRKARVRAVAQAQLAVPALAEQLTAALATAKPVLAGQQEGLW